MIIDAHMLARMLMERIASRRTAHYERLASGLPQNEYHALCGAVRETDALLQLIDEVRKLEDEDDDRDPLTDTQRNKHGRS